MPLITDEFRTLNHFEAGLWFVIAATAFCVALRRPAPGRARGILLSITLAAFGVSDIVEATTGAWWRPWWLLAWKAVCVAVFVAVLTEHYVQRVRHR